VKQRPERQNLRNAGEDSWSGRPGGGPARGAGSETVDNESTLKVCADNLVEGPVKATGVETDKGGSQRQWMKRPFRYFNSSPEIIR